LCYPFVLLLKSVGTYVFQTGITLSEWVQELPPYNPDAAGITMSAEEMLEVKQYQVM
jgi:hypothetical protein